MVVWQYAAMIPSDSTQEASLLDKFSAEGSEKSFSRADLKNYWKLRTTHLNLSVLKMHCYYWHEIEVAFQNKILMFMFKAISA